MGFEIGLWELAWMDGMLGWVGGPRAALGPHPSPLPLGCCAQPTSFRRKPESRGAGQRSAKRNAKSKPLFPPLRIKGEGCAKNPLGGRGLG